MGESDVLHGRFCQPDLDDGVLWELGEIGPEEGGVDTLVAPPWTHDVIMTSLLRQNDVIVT